MPSQAFSARLFPVFSGLEIEIVWVASNEERGISRLDMRIPKSSVFRHAAEPWYLSLLYDFFYKSPCQRHIMLFACNKI